MALLTKSLTSRTCQVRMGGIAQKEDIQQLPRDNGDCIKDFQGILSRKRNPKYMYSYRIVAEDSRTLIIASPNFWKPPYMFEEHQSSLTSLNIILADLPTSP